MADTPREVLHLPLFENTYALWVMQRVAQQQSGRFINGEVLTSGYRDVDRIVMDQKTQMRLPIVAQGDGRPSIQKLYSTGAYFDFVNNFDMRHAQKTLGDYLNAAVPWLEKQHGSGYGEMLESVGFLCELNDELITRLRNSGYSVDRVNFARMFRSTIPGEHGHLDSVKRTTLSDVVRNIRFRRGE